MKYKYLLIALFVGVLFIGLNSAFAAESTSNNVTKVTDATNNNNNNNNTNTNTNNNNNNNNSVAKTVTKPTKLSQKVIFTGSKSVKNYINKNGKAPNYITMNNYKFSMAEFLYLLTKATTYKYKGSSSDVTIKYNIKNPPCPSGANVNGYFKKANYYKVANNIANFITKNNQVPNYASTSLGKMNYQTLLFAYSRIGDYIGTYNKLPSSVQINVKISHSMNRYLPVNSGSAIVTGPAGPNPLFEDSSLIEQVKVITAYSPYSVKINKTHIIVTGALPRKSGYEYKRYDMVWKNYFNGQWGFLAYEQASLDGYVKNFSPIEGQLWYTKNDRFYDVDFDMVSGYSGDYGNKYKLESW
ncbi:MAG: hypothetical protein ACRC1M_03745 [Methanobacteriaceae archaeon]